jgi:hypothetical protein
MRHEASVRRATAALSPRVQCTTALISSSQLLAPYFKEAPLRANARVSSSIKLLSREPPSSTLYFARRGTVGRQAVQESKGRLRRCSDRLQNGWPWVRLPVVANNFSSHSVQEGTRWRAMRPGGGALCGQAMAHYAGTGALCGQAVAHYAGTRWCTM